MTLDCMHERIQKLSENVMLVTKQTRAMQDELKQLHKIFKQTERQNKNRAKRPQVKMNVSNELQTFLKVDNDSKLTKAEVMKQVSTYIKEKDLQLKLDRRRFMPNKELSKIFGIKKAQDMTFVEINKYVSHHLSV